MILIGAYREPAFEIRKHQDACGISVSYHLADEKPANQQS